MISIPAGTFVMGSPANEPLRRSDEGPQRTVSVPSFFVGVYPVTFDEWEACAADGGCDGYRPSDNNWGRGRRPVTSVTWVQAQSYVRWLAGKSKKPYRLLTEAEWEYAARAGTSTPFWFGATITTEQANYNGRYAPTDVAAPDYWDHAPAVVSVPAYYLGIIKMTETKRSWNAYGSSDKYLGQTVPVGSYPKNGFGLYDMNGNVWEWVEDCYADGYRDAPSTAAAVVPPACGNLGARVYRGGSYHDGPWELRSAARMRNPPLINNSDIGFRVARAATP
jgi:formylglycine-generating enzyme required for sulfatase activity